MRSGVFVDEIPVTSRGELDVIDITPQVRSCVGGSGVVNGMAHVFIAGSTASLTTIEYEPGAVSDLKAAFERMAPDDLEYAHNRAWGDGNGHSHVRAAVLGPGITVPVRGGDIFLGTWQQIVMVEFDTRSRNRKAHVTVVGEVLNGESVDEIS